MGAQNLSPDANAATLHTIFRPLIRLQRQMTAATVNIEPMTTEQDRRISDAVEREQARLRNFIRRRVPDVEDADDILQDVFFELVEAYRLMKPLRDVGAWLFRVARNRITDRFRRKSAIPFSEMAGETDGAEMLAVEEMLPSLDAGPEAEFMRSLLLDEIEAAVAELPQEQREVFIAHEINGRSFKQLAAETNVSVNTLLSRKRYAVLYLRERLQTFYDELTGG